MITRTAVLFFIILLSTLLFMMPSQPVHAYTLTFDDAPPGQGILYYWDAYGAHFGGSFYQIDHSGSTWGVPRSGNNVLRVWWEPGDTAKMVKFHSYENPDMYYSIRSLGAYFSTQPDVVVRMEAHRSGVSEPVSSALIGETGKSWNNVYVEVSSALGDIDFVRFVPVSSDDALIRFCADDMTIEPVPEPSALVGLIGGLGAVVIPLLRRRR